MKIVRAIQKEKEAKQMKVRFQVDIPLRERFRILWFGRVYVAADYKGQHKPLRVEIGAVNKRDLKNDSNE